MVSVFRMAMSPFGRILIGVCTMPMVKTLGDDQRAFVITAAVWSAIALVLLLWCFIKCEEKVVIPAREVKKEKEKGAGMATLKALVTNQYFWALTALWMLKNSSDSVQDIRRFKDIGGEDFVVFNGPDEQYVAGRLMGADSGIGGTYAAMPELLLAADRFLEAGDFEGAQAVQAEIWRIITVFCSGKSNMYAVIKEYLRQYKGLALGGVRAPLTAFVPEDAVYVEKAAAMIEQAEQRFAAK